MNTRLDFQPLAATDPYRLVDVEAEIDLALNRDPDAIIQQLLAAPPGCQTGAWRRALERCIVNTPLYDQIDANIALYGAEFVRDRLWRIPRAERNRDWLAAWELVDARWWEQQGVVLDEGDEIPQLADQTRAA